MEYDYVLGARCLHYRAAYANVRSDNVRNSHMDGISIVLPRGEFSVSGVVVDANGKPVADARIWCSGEGQIGINSRTDADGKFKAAQLVRSRALQSLPGGDLLQQIAELRLLRKLRTLEGRAGDDAR